jgi:5-(carboxyamino)imidazole ribonucleotide synthase
VTAPVVGILGAGQLGRMLALAGVPLGVRCICLDPAPAPPAAAAAEVLTAPFDDRAGLEHLARRCDVVTIEVEHVPVEALEWLAERLPVHPSPAVVAVAQDRLAEKQALRAAGVATAPWAEPPGLASGFPNGTIVKTRVGGYDGRGQVRLPPGGDVQRAADGLGVPCIAEGVVSFDREVSVLAARTTAGEVAVWPVVENRHHLGILRESLAPAPGLAPALQAEADAQVRSLLAHLGHVGVLALELFDVGGLLVANEIAPRVHNSGHWTIEGAHTSQFEQHLRAVLGWPLGDPAPIGHSAMVNLVGGEPDPREVLAVAGAHLHRYGKAPRSGRKVGHITVTAPSPDVLVPALEQVRTLVAGATDG